MIDISIPNLQILANAGSGKTHTLVTRIIRLLVLGVHPRRIIALTFTRKAAGEFLSKLLQRLATAALDPSAADQLSEAIGEKRDSTTYQKLLREVVQNLGKLQFTTLDSFFHRIATAFPLELGLSGTPVLLDTHAKVMAARSSLRHALARLTPSEKNLLLQAFFERDEGSIPSSSSEDLDAFCDTVHEPFLDHPEGDAWGNPRRIWGSESNPWPTFPPAELANYRDIVSRETGSPEFSVKTRTAWNQLQILTRGIKANTVISKILDTLDLWKSGKGSFKYYKESYEISFAASQAAAALSEHYLHECTEYRLREARAIHHLLAHYEAEYDNEVRRHGMLTFSDVTRLLQPETNFMGLGRESSSGTDSLRLQLDERLDALFDHWLLDEFQDTSRSQYRVLENILDEVISEAARGGERSFFCVGDVKQAIYGWREGDSRLFEELYHRYHLGNGLIRKPLADSWRSSGEILSTLNTIFGDLPSTAPTLPAEVIKRWTSSWTHHHRSTSLNPLPGYFSWQTHEGKNEEEKLEEEVIQLLQTIQPRLKEGMTIALLVRSGREANEWLEILRRAGIEALCESNPPVGRDNPVAAAVRSALSLSVHPGDRFARNHLSMEPLRGIFFPLDQSEKEVATLMNQTAKLLVNGGFNAVMEWLLNKLSPLIQDEFSRGRADALRRAALKADSSGITDVDDFLMMLEGYEEKGCAAPQAVQIMTVHKSKGLEYDMVVIPLSGMQKAVDSLGFPKLEKYYNQQGEPFLIKLPAEEIRAVPNNETLAAAAAQQRIDRAFEELCVWYVALSRAKRALYIFSPVPKKLDAGKCPNFPQLLKAGMEKMANVSEGSFGDGPTRLGDPKWYEKFRPQSTESPRDLIPRVLSIPPRPASFNKSSPSNSGHHVQLGDQAFLASNATALGSEIHAIFESIEWLPANLSGSISPEARELILPRLEHPSIDKLFSRPQGSFTLWREQQFDLVLDGEWISGCFDRVVIFRDTHGHAVDANLIDFKTDQGGREKLIANYRPQLEKYRFSLSKILNLPEEKIRMILIHLRSDDPVIEV